MTVSLAQSSAWSLIAPDNTWALWAIIASWIAACIWLEQRARWAARISGPVLILLGAIVLANTRVIPLDAPVYDTIWSYVVPVCIPLLLFRANIVTIVRESGPMFLVFHLSAIGTVVGAFLAAVLLRGAGIEELDKLIGIMTGSYTGGSVNFTALTATLEPENKTHANALLVADNLIMTVMFLVCFSMTSMPLLRRLFPAPYAHAAERDPGAAATQAAAYWKPKPIALLDIAQALAIAVVIAGVSHLVAGAVDASSLPDLVKGFLGQPYLVITAVCVVVASTCSRWLERIAGAEELGTYLIYLFFFVIGAPADLVTVFGEVPMLFVLCAIMAVTNLVVTLALTKLFRQNLEEAALAVNATLGGAPSAAALAVAKGWTPLVLPAILAGVWGYVIGTYLGLAVRAGILWMM